MGGIRDHWKAQDPGPTSGGPRLLAAAHHQEAVGGETQREVVMEAPPTPPLEVAEANFLLEFSVILFDPPAAFGRGDDVVEGRMARQGDQPIANRIRGPDRPLEQQRLFALSPVSPAAPPDRGEASAQPRSAASPPRDPPPRRAGHACGQRPHRQRRVLAPPQTGAPPVQRPPPPRPPARPPP